MQGARHALAHNGSSLVELFSCCLAEWYYGWVPVLGTLAGGAAAGSLVDALVKLLVSPCVQFGHGALLGG